MYDRAELRGVSLSKVAMNAGARNGPGEGLGSDPLLPFMYGGPGVEYGDRGVNALYVEAGSRDFADLL